MSNVGKWGPWYDKLPPDMVPTAYGPSPAYELGAGWLIGCSLVEDWGCGLGYMRYLIPAANYRGIDGTSSDFCDEVVDLSTYRSSVPGIYMRAVIEHNYDWATILANALASFTERMALVVFTPTDGPTRQVDFVEELGVPDIAIALDDIIAAIDEPGNILCHREAIPVEMGYGQETIFYLERSKEELCVSP